MRKFFNTVWDFILDNLNTVVSVAFFTFLFVGFIWFCRFIIVDGIEQTRIDNISQETCSPNEMIKRFDSKGKHLVVCNTEQGLVVREVKENK